MGRVELKWDRFMLRRSLTFERWSLSEAWFDRTSDQDWCLALISGTRLYLVLLFGRRKSIQSVGNRRYRGTSPDSSCICEIGSNEDRGELVFKRNEVSFE